MNKDRPLIRHPFAGIMYGCKKDCRSCTMAPMEYDPVCYSLLNLRKDFIGIDLGAHVGLYGVALKNLAKEMHSFEIEQNGLDCLYKNSILYPHIRPYNIAAWDKNEIIGVYFDKGPSAELKISDEKLVTSFLKEEYFQSKVVAVSLDTFFPEKFKIDFVKIDIEGSEVRALNGMKNLLFNNKNLILVCEFNKNHLKRFGNTVEEFIEAIEDCRFKFVSTTPEKLIEAPDDYLCNIVAVK